jgi:hypothetical protein
MVSELSHIKGCGQTIVIRQTMGWVKVSICKLEPLSSLIHFPQKVSDINMLLELKRFGWQLVLGLILTDDTPEVVWKDKGCIITRRQQKCIKELLKAKGVFLSQEGRCTLNLSAKLGHFNIDWGHFRKVLLKSLPRNEERHHFRKTGYLTSVVGQFSMDKLPSRVSVNDAPRLSSNLR